MAKQLTNMTGDEFIEKVLSGERDLSYIRLEPGFDLVNHPRYPNFLEYTLRVEGMLTGMFNPGENYSEKVEHEVGGGISIGFDNKGRVYHKAPEGEVAFEQSGIMRSIFAGNNHLCLDHSELKSLNANGVNLPFLKANRSDLSGSNFYGSNLEHASFGNSKMTGVDFYGANLASASFCRGDVSESDFREAKIWGTEFRFAYLRKANFKGSKNVDKNHDWAHAFYDGTIVGLSEQRQIREDILRRIASGFLGLSNEGRRKIGLKEEDVEFIREYESRAHEFESGKTSVQPRKHEIENPEEFREGYLQELSDQRRSYIGSRKQLDTLLEDPSIISAIEKYLRTRDRFEYWLGKSKEKDSDRRRDDEEFRQHLEKLLAKTPERLFDIQ